MIRQLSTTFWFFSNLSTIRTCNILFYNLPFEMAQAQVAHIYWLERRGECLPAWVLRTAKTTGLA